MTFTIQPSGKARSSSRSRRKTLAALLAFLFAAADARGSQAPWAKKEIGVLLLGHGGSLQWDRAVRGIKTALEKKFPIEVAIGMADRRELQRGLDLLAAQNVKKVVVVPLFISSQSEVMEQTKYLLGLRREPSEEFMLGIRKMQQRAAAGKLHQEMLPHAHDLGNPVKRARVRLPVAMTSALDDHPLVAEVLAARAKEMSRNPAKESVVIVGHGPWKDEDNEVWLRNIDALGAAVKRSGGFAEVHGATLRDDAPDNVRERAVKNIRKLVGGLSLRGKVLVVPFLVAEGGIERKLLGELDGLFFQWRGKALLPDERITRWVELKAEEGAGQPDMRMYKDDGLPLPGPERKVIVPIDGEKAR